MSWFGDPSLAKRSVALLALLAVSVLVMAVVAKFVGLPSGYNAAQSQSSQKLARHPTEWPVWKRAAMRDLLIFVPVYVAYGVAALAGATAGRPLFRWCVLAMIGAGVADMVETLLFRGTLDRLLHGTAATELSTRTSVTAAATYVKYGCLVLVLLGLAFSVLGPRGRSA